MKRLLLLAGIAVFLSGCSSVQGTRQAPDGSRLTIRSTRWFWKSEAVTFSLTDTNGVRVEMGLGKSGSDSDSIQAISYGAAKGVADAMKKGITP